MNAYSWVGRIVVVAAALLGANLALQEESSAELPRFVPIILTHTKPFPTHAFATRAGALDQMIDTPEGLLVEGWMSKEVDSIFLVVGRADEPNRQKARLLARPDVEATGEALYSGFRVVFGGVEKSSVHCVIFDGPSGSEEMWSSGNGCA